VSGKDCATDPDICINLEARLAHPCASCAAFMSGKSERAFVEDPNGTAGKHGFAWTLAAPEARACLDRVMLRRKRADVLPDLPTKRYATLACDLDAASLAACDAALSGGFLREGESAEELHARLSKPAEFTTVSSLLEKLSTAKIPSLLEHVQAFEESEEPLVVFSPHRRPVEALAGREGWLSILGDDTPEARAKKVDAFQGGRYRGIAGTTAMGTSVTLTRASHVLFCGRPWNPEKGRQMEDRVCRIGQDRGVMVYDLVSEHPLDARLSEVLRGKNALIGSLL
jgi:SNF2 family DNA or RNA helicase